MDLLHKDIEPYKSGYLQVGNGDNIYWECCGNKEGKPALVVHGGPGSGATSWWRKNFDPKKYNIILFDQRGCGRSYPLASDPNTSLQDNKTRSLVKDMEKLRNYLKIEKWLLLGGSWGSTLALMYAITFPEKVSGMVLFGVTTGRHSEFEWCFNGGLSKFFPEQWEKLIKGIKKGKDTFNVVKSYYEMLNDPDPNTRKKATENWCMWESATPIWPPTGKLQERFSDSEFAYGFARLVTHYVSHNAWIEDGIILNNCYKLKDIPGVLINGRFDFQAPIENAWELKKKWPNVQLKIIDDSGHSPSDTLEKEILIATNKLADSNN